jgi:hypothetical protein
VQLLCSSDVLDSFAHLVVIILSNSLNVITMLTLLCVTV